LIQSPNVELAGVCDVVKERAAERAEEFGVPLAFDDFDRMLTDLDFDLLVNLTAMPSHFPLNLAALRAGKHVFCEKPIAAALEDGHRLLEAARENHVRIFGAPNVVTSPAFRCLAEVIRSGEIGEVRVAHGRYGHGGPTWGPWFYQKGGGSLFDLGVYNVTTLTGLLGPARSVTALTGIAIPERTVEGQRVRVEADDNTMLLMDHGGATFSCVQTGFVYPNLPEGQTLEIVGRKGTAGLLGYDWGPEGVRVRTEAASEGETRAADQQGYGWERGASTIAECLATGTDPPMTGEHALHVLEVMLAALESGRSGRRIEIESRFRWPVIG